MEIYILTAAFKKANRFQNVSLLFVFLFLVLFFISLEYLANSFMLMLLMISLLGLSLMLLSIISCAIYKQFHKKVININTAEITSLILNTGNKMAEIKNKTGINYADNFLKITGDSQDYEISRASAFEIITNTDNIEIEQRNSKTNLLDVSFAELFHQVMTFFTP